MNYFIDFEATQFSNRIISVGCVKETGETFYSLVNPERELTQFIIDFTKITQEQVDAAPSANEVFEKLFDFCSQDDEAPTFYCYGDSDTAFAKATLEKMATTFKAKSMLSYIYANLIDFCPAVRVHFGIYSSVKLIKVAEYYKKEEMTQTHNALDDALLLKYVYEQVQEHDDEFDAFPEYRAQKAVKAIEQKTAKNENKESAKGDMLIFRMKKGKVAETYYSLEDAIVWVIEHKIHASQRNIVNAENIGKKIKSAAMNHKQYCKITWAISTADIRR